MNESIYGAFYENVLKYPNAVALIYGSKQYTYLELGSKVDIVAYNLVANGLKGGRNVAINFKKSDRYIILILALLKIGCCYVPLSDKFPKERIFYICKQSNASMIISGNLEEYTINSILLDDLEVDSDGIKQIVGYNNELAYVLFTSGTTGNPKGIEIFQKSVINLVKSMREKLIKEKNIGVKIGLLSEMVFDVSVGQIYLALLTGNTLVVFEDIVKMDFLFLSREMTRLHMNIMDFTPTFLSMYLNYFEGRDEISFPEAIISMGEPLPVNLVKNLYAFPEADSVLVHNYYGPTETCVYATCFSINKSCAEKLDRMFVGNVLNNMEVFILDDKDECCSHGKIGEICIAGVGLAKGYINNSEQTHKSFVENRNIYPKRFYRTGDYGRIYEDGLIEYLGRKDSQVKFHGYRIELSEIENVINNVDGIIENRVLLEKDGEQSYIVSYFSASKDITLEYVKGEIGKMLPVYMVPGFFVRVNHFPITINGKLDKNALPNFRKHLLKTERDNSEIELTELQQNILDIFRNSLKSRNLGLFDELKTYGVDSLNIIITINAITNAFKVNITVFEIIKQRNIYEVCCLVESKKKKADKDLYELKELYECNTFQKIIVDLEKKANEKRDKAGIDKTPTYNIIYEIECSESLDENKLRQCMDKLSENPIFSVNINKNYFMFFNDHRNKYILDYFDYEELKSHDIIDYATDFNIEKDPMIQVCVFKTEKTTKILLNIHHAVFDYLSTQNFIRDLFQTYLPGTEPDHNNRFFQYTDKRIEYMDEAIEYWKAYYKDRGRCNQIKGDLRLRNRNLADDVFEILTITKDSYWINENIKPYLSDGITSFYIYICAWAMLLNFFSKESDIIVGTYLPGRNVGDSTYYDAYGCFLNAVGLRFRLNEKSELKGIINIFKEEYFLTEKYQFLSFFDIVSKLEKEDLIKGELIGSLFNYVSFEKNNFEHLRVKIKEIGLEPEMCTMSIKIYDHGDKVTFGLKYNKNVYSDFFIQTVMKQYLNLIESL